MTAPRPVMPPTPSTALLPFESQLLAAVADTLDPEWRALLLGQIACINQIKRRLDWKEIEFHHQKWFRTRWPEAVLLPRRESFVLAQARCTFGSKEACILVRAAGGHIFSLESSVGMSGLSIAGPFEVKSISRGHG